VKGNQWGIGANTASVGGMRTGSFGFPDADAVVISYKSKERHFLVRAEIGFFIELHLGQGGGSGALRRVETRPNRHDEASHAFSERQSTVLSLTGPPTLTSEKEKLPFPSQRLRI
jgi:hypothetical protein